MKIKDIQEYINDNMLDLIYKGREDIINERNDMDKKEIAKITEKYPVNYEKLLNSINNIPPHFKNIREDILNTLDAYLMRENLLYAYDNEKFYKIGFCDGVKTIIDNIK